MNNGRINFNTENTNNKFNMMDRIPVNSNTNFSNVLTGIFETSRLSDAFFSRNNLNLIQKKLKEGVYLKSNKQIMIDTQPEETIQIVMRSYYLEYSCNIDSNIDQQVHKLNNMVLNYLINNAYSEAIAYLKYKKDASNMYTLMEKPQYSDKTNKTLEYKPWF